jgi:hypothetical protein
MYAKYPLFGTDYGLAVPSILDSALHMRINGLSIQWYTPTFGGGQPAYPDPINSQFSLQTILTMFLDPMLTIVISIILFVAAGFFASYYFFSRILKLDMTTSVLGAVFFSANGYMMERIAIGHLGYISFPLLPLMLILLVDERIPKYVAGLLFALLIAALLHMAGYYIIILCGFSILIIFPLLYIVRPVVLSWKRIFLVVTVGGCLAALMSISKLSAVYSYMRFFPRLISNEYSSSLLLSLLGIILQLMGTMSLLPIRWLVGLDPRLLPENIAGITGIIHDKYWEFDMAVSPVIFGIIIMGIDSLLHQPTKLSSIFIKEKRWLAWLILIVSTWLVTQIILARGIIYPLIGNLPIISSLHVNYRITAAFIFPLALIAAVLYNRWSVHWERPKALIILTCVNLLTLGPLFFYLVPDADFVDRTYDVSDSQRIHREMLAGNIFEVTQIGYTGNNNTLALLNQTSNLDLYNPIFGFGLEFFHPEVRPGSVWEISDGYYNMTNPTGFVFPEENNTRAFERIRVEDKARMAAFVAHRQPDWAIPVYQQVCDWISGLSTIVVAGTAMMLFARWLASFRQIKRTKDPISA